jgi:hypothetical protein
MEKTFYIPSRAWYNKLINRIEPLRLYIYYSDDEISGEFKIEWQDLSGKFTPQLQVYDDAWKVLFDKLSDVHFIFCQNDSKDISLDDLTSFLVQNGFEDSTPYNDSESLSTVKNLEIAREKLLQEVDNLTEKIKALS